LAKDELSLLITEFATMLHYAALVAGHRMAKNACLLHAGLALEALSRAVATRDLDDADHAASQAKDIIDRAIRTLQDETCRPE